MSVIPAQPGWTALFAFGCPGEEPDVEVQLAVIAAWKVEDDDYLQPIARCAPTIMAPADAPDYDCEGSTLVAIFEPGQALPSEEEQRELARKNYKIRQYLIKHAPKETTTP